MAASATAVPPPIDAPAPATASCAPVTEPQAIAAPPVITPPPTLPLPDATAAPADAAPSPARRPSPAPSARPAASAPSPASVATKPTSDERDEISDLQKMLSGGDSGRRSAPSRAEIAAMPVAAAVRALEQFVENARVVDAVLDRWRGLSYGPARRQSAAEVGALPAIVKAMQVHREAPAIQEAGSLSIGNIVAGIDEEGIARKQTAADAGALQAITTGMQLHVQETAVQEYGCFAIGNICFAADEAGLKRKQMAADACAISAIVTGMRAHSGESAVQEYGCFALGNICRAVGGAASRPAEQPAEAAEGEEAVDEEKRAALLLADEQGRERKESAVEAGALGVIVNAMRFFAKEKGIQTWGSRALSNITFGVQKWREMAREAGARPQWLTGIADAMDHITDHRASPNSKTERLAIQPPQAKASQTVRSPAERVPNPHPHPTPNPNPDANHKANPHAHPHASLNADPNPNPNPRCARRPSACRRYRQRPSRPTMVLVG